MGKFWEFKGSVYELWFGGIDKHLEKGQTLPGELHTLLTIF